MKEKGLRGIIRWGEEQKKTLDSFMDFHVPWDLLLGKLKEMEKKITSNRQNSLKNVEFYKGIRGMDTYEDEERERYYQDTLAEVLDGLEVEATL